MLSDVEEEDSNENIMTDEDKQKYQYLQPFFELVKVARGNRPNVRNLFFKCLKCPNSKPKMCQEGSMSNLDRHYKSDLHSAIYSEWQKVFKIKPTKRKSGSNEAGPSGVKEPKQQKISQFFRSNCSQTALNEAIVDDIIDSMGPFKRVEEESFKALIKLLDPNKQVPCYRTVVKILDEKYDNMKENLLDELANAVYVAIATVSNNIWIWHMSIYDMCQFLQ